ncbi:MAG: PilZ domain-containing protein [Thermodesulfobacteriota bacterium]
MTNEMEDERRKKRRVEFSTNIILKMDGNEIHVTGSSKDLSLNGVFINTPDNIPLNAACQVEIQLSGMVEPLLLRMKGTTVRKEPVGIAVLFESMDLDSYSHLKNIVRYNTTDPDSIY